VANFHPGSQPVRQAPLRLLIVSTKVTNFHLTCFKRKECICGGVAYSRDNAIICNHRPIPRRSIQ
jgi:hypothetical protein